MANYKREGPIKFDFADDPSETQKETSQEIKYMSSKMMEEAKKMSNPEYSNQKVEIGTDFGIFIIVLDKFKSNIKLFYPGKTPGQPFRRNYYRYCYKVMKPDV